jgi:amidase
VNDLANLGAAELARRIRHRQLSAREAVEAHLRAIERLNPTLNAFCTVAADRALQSADAADQALARGDEVGALHGVPIGIKDLTATAGIRTTWGSLLFKDHVPAEDAEVVVRLKHAGAIVLGKTNTPEFGAGANTVNEVFGATRNPWNPALSASGSTGGGAAALASGMVPLAEGNDFGGSLRTPAAFCGVVGLRTTAGLVPKHPTALPWHDQAVGGPMARSAEDCALLLDAMAGFSETSPLSSAPPWKSAYESVSKGLDGKNLRLAYVADIAGLGIDKEVEAICRRAAKSLAGAAACVDEIELDLSDARDAFVVLRGATMLANHLDRLDLIERLGPNLAGNIRYGMTLRASEIAQAERKRAQIWQRWRQIFKRYDAVLTPTAPVEPFPVEQNYPDVINGRKLSSYIDWIAQTFLVSLAALPAASVPAGLGSSGLPVGLQIVGPRFSEPTILALARGVEQANPIGFPPLHASRSVLGD